MWNGWMLSWSADMIFTDLLVLDSSNLHKSLFKSVLESLSLGFYQWSQCQCSETSPTLKLSPHLVLSLWPCDNVIDSMIIKQDGRCVCMKLAGQIAAICHLLTLLPTFHRWATSRQGAPPSSPTWEQPSGPERWEEGALPHPPTLAQSSQHHTVSSDS